MWGCGEKLSGFWGPLTGQSTLEVGCSTEENKAKRQMERGPKNERANTGLEDMVGASGSG